jgi:hypothetical protein
LEVRVEWKREVGEKMGDFFVGGEGTARLEHSRPPAGLDVSSIEPVLKLPTKTGKMI